jgi:hypothetical protein
VNGYYIEAELVVYGALDESNVFYTWAEFENYLKQVQQDESLSDAELFILEHEHEPSECECVQFVTNHRPYWSSES